MMARWRPAETVRQLAGKVVGSHHTIKSEEE